MSRQADLDDPKREGKHPQAGKAAHDVDFGHTIAEIEPLPGRRTISRKTRGIDPPCLTTIQSTTIQSTTMED